MSGRRVSGHVRRLLSVAPYVAAPGLAAAVPLLTIPAITLNFGVDDWASIAVGQAVGAGAGIVAELGWGVTGPQRAAAGSPHERLQLYLRSLVSKVLPVTVLALVAGITAWVLAPTVQMEAAVIAVGATGAALSQSWYFVGTGEPRRMILTDTVPRVVLTVSAAVTLFFGAPLVVYSAAALLFPVVTVALGLLTVRPGRLSLRAAPAVTRCTLREQRTISVGRAFGALYTALPIALVGAVNPGALAVFSAGERLMRMGLTLLAGFPARLQSWVGVAEGQEKISRARQTIGLSGALGLAAGAAYLVLAPAASQIIFAGQVTIAPGLAALFALNVVLICTSRGVGLALVAVGAANSITYAAVLAASLGAPAILLLSAEFGAEGGAMGEVVAECTGLAVQTIMLMRFLRAPAREKD